MNSLEQRIEKIEARNKRVEATKAWETSWLRRILILLVTYFCGTLLMWSLDTPKPYLNALVPALGFFLSTLTLDFAKRLYEKFQK